MQRAAAAHVDSPDETGSDEMTLEENEPYEPTRLRDVNGCMLAGRRGVRVLYPVDGRDYPDDLTSRGSRATTSDGTTTLSPSGRQTVNRGLCLALDGVLPTGIP